MPRSDQKSALIGTHVLDYLRSQQRPLAAPSIGDLGGHVRLPCPTRF